MMFLDSLCTAHPYKRLWIWKLNRHTFSVSQSFQISAGMEMNNTTTRMNLLSAVLVGTVLLPNTFCLFGIGTKQSVAVKDRLEWNGVPTSNPCNKKISIIVPDVFITRGSTPKSAFDIGTINLAGKFKGESIDCIN
ncbi:Transthyretin-like family protein [Necator americanus]|uniref:Transthyretin-like family protein n=1 Tax=Necator americanus TaxID=51031 RepID=W2T1N7_NECAM|nr:Transthyretin-like family protein [Necator americanus]ETN75910.1 Transthyretin-like family protein [Necator americanus]